MNKLAAVATHLAFDKINVFMPHGMCYLWQPGLMGLHLVSDGIIALSYFSIPITLVHILRKRKDIPFDGIFLLFAAFILCCGTTHAFAIWTLWYPYYWVSGGIKLLTALVSLATAIALIIKIPEILTLPSPRQMKGINQQLKTKIAELVQQKAIIREQEEFLRSIYDNVKEAIFVVNIESDGTFCYQGFNPAAQKLTGIEDVMNKTPAAIFPPETTIKVTKHYRDCLEAATAISYEECLSFQGQDTWWLTTLNPIQDETGKIYRIIGTSLNINDRKLAKTALEQEKNFLQALLDNLSDGIVACDEHGVLTLFNQATKEFHGLRGQAIHASEWATYYALYLNDGKTIMPQEDIPLFRALQGESVRDVEMMIMPKQGKPRTILANGDPIVDRHGNKIGAIVAMRDITERLQAEAELEKERIFIKEMLNNLSDGIVACDENGMLALFNQASQAFFGKPQEPIPPEQWAEYYSLYYPDGKTYLKKEDVPLFRAFSGESFTNAKFMAIPPHSEPRIFLTNGSPIIDSQGTKLGAVVAVRDITEKLRTEQALAELNNQLEERVKQRTLQLEQVNLLLLGVTEKLQKSNEELEQFAYVASHDLKAPLRAIANLSEWIEEDLEDKLDDDSRKNMNLLRRRVHRLENLINGLLAYSRVGRLNAEPELVSVAQMLAEIMDMLDVYANFTVEIRGEMPTFVTEAIPLRQVFNNLISNAIQHSDCDNGKIIISVKEQADLYKFTVTDNGKGIDLQYHERIFAIFQTLQSRDIKESTGIGLAIVKKAVENQGGNIKVISQLGAGTTFSFTWKKKTNSDNE